jgi:DNA primase
LFVDGDRGGQLIARNVINNARVKDVAIAPDGKEVEELTGKEILMALRKKVPVGVYLRMLSREGERNFNSPSTRVEEVTEEAEPEQEAAEYSGDAKKKIRELYETIRGTKATLMLDSNLEVLKKTISKEVPGSLGRLRARTYAIIIDGNATSAMIKLCEEEGIKYLGATTFAHADHSKVQLISL